MQSLELSNWVWGDVAHTATHLSEFTIGIRKLEN